MDVFSDMSSMDIIDHLILSEVASVKLCQTPGDKEMMLLVWGQHAGLKAPLLLGWTDETDERIDKMFYLHYQCSTGDISTTLLIIDLFNAPYKWHNVAAIESSSFLAVDDGLISISSNLQQNPWKCSATWVSHYAPLMWSDTHTWNNHDMDII